MTGPFGRARRFWQSFVEQQREYARMAALLREPVAWQEFRLLVAAHCVRMVAEERKLKVIEVLAIVDRYVTIVKEPPP